MADEAAPREKVGAGEEARPLLTEAAPNTAELKDACAATETTTSETNVDIHGKRTTLVEQIALLEALRGARRSWPQNDDKDADLRVPGDPIKTEGASTRRTRAYFVWTALVFLLLVAVLTLQDTPQLCFQGYCLNYQPSPITSFRGGPRRDMALVVRDQDQSAGVTEWVWSLDPDGKLSRRQMGTGTEWDTYEATRFLGAPVIQRCGSTVRLFAVEAGTGHLMVGAFFREDHGRAAGLPNSATDADEEAQRRAEAWDRAWAARPGAWGWHSLGGRFAHQPTVTEAATGHVEAYAVTEKGALLRRVLAPGAAGGWGAWSVLGNHGFVGEVDVLVAYMDHGHVVQQGEVRAAAIKDGQYQSATSDVSPRPWNGVWRPLGVPDSCRGGAELGWPLLVALARGVFEFVVACGGGIWHKTYGWDGEWASHWEAVGTVPKGVQLDTHGLTRSSQSEGGPASLYAHASVSGCVHQSTYVGREQARAGWQRRRRSPWSHWRRIWCPEEKHIVGNVSLAVDTVGGRAVALGEPDGSFLYSGVIDFHSSDPLQWQRHDRPQSPPRL